MTERLAIFAEGLWERSDAKTGHGVLRFGDRDVACVIDSTRAGERSAEVVPFARRDVPIVADVDAAIALGATAICAACPIPSSDSIMQPIITSRTRTPSARTSASPRAA